MASTLQAIDPADATAVAPLAEQLAAHVRDVDFTWSPQAAVPPAAVGQSGPSYGEGGWTLGGDVLGGPTPDEVLIRRAVGVLALVGAGAAQSGVLRAQLEIAYSWGIPVEGFRVDDSTASPANLAAHAIGPYDLESVSETVAMWRRRRHLHAGLSWPARVRHALVADRDSRR